MNDLDEELLVFLEAFIAEKGYSPSVRQIMEGVNRTSFKGVMHSLTRLRENGIVTWQDGQSRTLKVVDDGRIREDADGVPT